MPTSISSLIHCIRLEGFLLNILKYSAKADSVYQLRPGNLEEAILSKSKRPDCEIKKAGETFYITLARLNHTKLS